jgi:O-antigen/teichoic acid export membrane protein
MSDAADEMAGAKRPARIIDERLISTDGAPLSTSDERVSRSATFAFFAQLVGGVLTGALTIFLGRELSAAQFGTFTFALGVITIATLFSDAGISSSTARFLAEQRGRPEEAAAVFRSALRLKLMIGVPATFALFFLAGPICETFGTSSALWAVRWCAVALLAQTCFSMTLYAFIALGKVRYNLVLATIESVIEVAATVLLVALSATAAAAAFGRVIGFGVGIGAALLLVNRRIGSVWIARRESRGEGSSVTARRILGYAGPLLLVDIAFRAFVSIDVLLIAALVGAGAPVAAFGLPMRLTVFLEYPAAAIASAVAPRLTQRAEDDVLLMAQAMRYLAIVQMLFTVPLLIWPEAIMHLLFGDKYAEAPEVLRLLAPYVLLSGIAQLTTVAVNYLGQAWRRVPIAIAMFAINLTIDVTLLPKIGIIAGAIGTSAAYALWVPAHVWILRTHGGLRIRPYVLTVVRTAIAGAAMLGALALIGTGRVAPAMMVLGAALGTAVYVVVLYALREVGPSDVEVVRRVLGRRLASS